MRAAIFQVASGVGLEMSHSEQCGRSTNQQKTLFFKSDCFFKQRPHYARSVAMQQGISGLIIRKRALNPIDGQQGQFADDGTPPLRVASASTCDVCPSDMEMLADHREAH
jgi:hypothetical protein